MSLGNAIQNDYITWQPSATMRSCTLLHLKLSTLAAVELTMMMHNFISMHARSIANITTNF